jgi:hypothetical protein
VTVNDASLSGADAGNYTLNAAATTAAIAKATLTVTVNNVTQYSGQAISTFTATYYGLANGDTPASLTGTLNFGTAAANAALKTEQEKAKENDKKGFTKVS